MRHSYYCLIYNLPDQVSVEVNVVDIAFCVARIYTGVVKNKHAVVNIVADLLDGIIVHVDAE